MPPLFIKGAVWGFGFDLEDVGGAYLLTDEDFAELQRRYKDAPPINRGCRNRGHLATA